MNIPQEIAPPVGQYEPTPFVICGNKSDLADQRTVTLAKGIKVRKGENVAQQKVPRHMVSFYIEVFNSSNEVSTFVQSSSHFPHQGRGAYRYNFQKSVLTFADASWNVLSALKVGFKSEKERTFDVSWNINVRDLVIPFNVVQTGQPIETGADIIELTQFYTKCNWHFIG